MLLTDILYRDRDIRLMKSMMSTLSLRRLWMKLSVIVPVYNSADYIESCLEDLLTQTIWKKSKDNMEIIVVNDASTDKGGEIIERFIAENPKKIKSIILKKNHGPGGARNYGLQEACGDYIGFMDSDDRINRHMYEKLIEMAENSDNPDFVDCGIRNEADGYTGCYSAIIPTGVLNDGKRSQLLLAVGYIWSRIYKRDFLIQKKIRFRENAVMEDQDFLSEVIARSSSMAVVPKILYCYSNTKDSASKKDAEISFFHSTIETINATYRRLSVLPNYENLRAAVEYNFWQLYLMNIQTIEAYYENGIIDERNRNNMLSLINRLMDKVMKTDPLNNEYIVKNKHKVE